jgi:putative phage-type endonuclease
MVVSVVAERIGTWEPGSAAWHAARLQGVTASEIAAVLGLSPWESAWALWHRKAGLIGPAPENAEQAWGRVFEGPIAQRFTEEHPQVRVTRCGTYRSRLRPYQIANPDRLCWPGRIPLEIKWSPYGDGWGEEGSGIVPIYYRCQVLWQMDVLGVDHALLAALVGTDFRVYRVDWHEDDAQLLRAAAQTFRASLPTADNPAGDPPNLDDSTHTYRAVREMPDGIEDVEQVISDELAVDFRTARTALADAEKSARWSATRVLFAMGSARRAVTPDGTRVAIRVPGTYGIQLRETKPKKQSAATVKEALAS